MDEASLSCTRGNLAPESMPVRDVRTAARVVSEIADEPDVYDCRGEIWKEASVALP
jgi:hypothetical protein